MPVRSMQRKYQLFLTGLLSVAGATLLCLPMLWPQLTGKNKDFDRGGVIFLVCLLVVANIGFLIATLWARSRARQAQPETGELGPSLGSRPGEPEAFVRLDFKRT